jgi:hypothetical protein
MLQKEELCGSLGITIVQFSKTFMSDNDERAVNLDPQSTDMIEEEFNSWSKKFGVSPEELKKAIEKAGLSPEVAEAYFKKGLKSDE